MRGLGEGDHLGHQQHPKRTVLRHREIHPQLSLFQFQALKVAQRFEIPQQFSVGFKVFRRVFLQPGNDRVLNADAGGAEGFAQQVLLAVEHVNQVGDVRHRQLFRRYANLDARLFRFKLRLHPALGDQEGFQIGGLFVRHVNVAFAVNGNRAYRVVECRRASIVWFHSCVLCKGFDQRAPVGCCRGEFHIHASFSFGMPFITLKAQKVKRMQAYLSFRSTASKSMLDIAWVAAVAPVTVSVGREHLPAVQTGGPIDGIRVLPNRLRVFRPPFPAARIRAEFSLAPTAGLYQLRAAAQAGFRRFGIRPSAYSG